VEEVEAINFYDPEVGEDFAAEVQQMAAVLERLDSQFDFARLHLYMTAYTGMLDEMRGHLTLFASGKSRSRAYDVSYLTRCFFLCDALSNAAALKDVLINAARVLLPLKAAEILQRSLDGDERAPVPSASTISRLRGRIDMAWAMVWRSRIREWLCQGVDPVVYPGTDSSPQGGRDYQILVLDFVAGNDLASLHCDVVALEQRCPSTVDKTNRLAQECAWRPSCVLVSDPMPFLQGLGTQ